MGSIMFYLQIKKKMYFFEKLSSKSHPPIPKQGIRTCFSYVPRIHTRINRHKPASVPTRETICLKMFSNLKQTNRELFIISLKKTAKNKVIHSR